MGAKGVRIARTQEELNDFTRNLLKDVKALERMLEENLFDTEVIHIGAEQEICLIDENFKPAPKSVELLRKLKNPSFTTELAKFNLEANLQPVPFSGDCFSIIEQEINNLLDNLKKAASEMDISAALTGILPTIRKFDLEPSNLTPIDRYYALIEAIEKMRGKVYELRLEGLDELNIKHHSALVEACNTSFQVHLQIDPDNFVEKYNTALAIAAPVMAISSNSPMLFGKRLWNETRIALFHQSIDTRITGEHLRYTSPRVTFGNAWLKNSILELIREDIVRFKVLLMTDVDEDVNQCLDEGVTPKLRALNVHNSTVYRWNRPCYGISPNGKPHLRIENRILPAGPTVLDEVANAAFWLGLMNGLNDVYPDITKKIDFDDAKSNFIKAAKLGLGAKFYWTDQKIINDTELIEKELLPIAKQGLEKTGVSANDISKYLDIVAERNTTHRTGSRWILESYNKIVKHSSKEEATTALVASMVKNQNTNKPVSSWDLAKADDLNEWSHSAFLVEEFMTTDLFTITKEDIPEFGADMMDWQKLRYLPIEDDKGELIGLLTHRELLRFFADCYKDGMKQPKNLDQIMIKNPITINPEQTIVEAMEIMMENNIGCLPVVNNSKLVGIITEANFLNITASLLKRLKRKKAKVSPEVSPETSPKNVSKSVADKSSENSSEVSDDLKEEAQKMPPNGTQ